MSEAIAFDWKQIMQAWSSELMTTDLGSRIGGSSSSSNWLGNLPADPTAIEELQLRLGLTLPPSYRTFLGVSDGWGRLDSFIGRLRPASEVDWFVRENEQWADVYAEFGDSVDDNYLSYGDNGIELSLCGSHTRHLLQISDVEDGVIVLNPLIQSHSGEWEGWFFANWIPGARRYPSFAHLMLATYRSMRSVKKVKHASFRIPSLPIPSAGQFTLKKPSQLKSKGKRKAPSKSAVSLTALVRQLSENIERPDKKLLRMLAGKLKGRHSAQRDAILTEQLSEIFNRSRNADVRAVAR